MSDIKIAMQTDANNPISGDLYLENGTIRLTRTLQEEVSQLIRISLRLFKGEWFLDPTQGMPYWQSILGQKTSLPVITQIFRRSLSKVPGVASINAFSVDRAPNRGLVVTFRCSLSDGTVLDSTSFQPFLVGA